MNVTEAFGAVVRAERQQQGLTLSDLALRSGMNWRHLSRVERGESVPSLVTIFALANALEIPPRTLIGMVEDHVTTGRRASKAK
ncbi:helix-turn-helix domain-containing protein [Aquabacterium sp. A7-Y]|uniref:helix-turn-helix domain-containing protein n=1 Tax=Aquabacterium sp. A7-Y TaxID=1349605 RepID=UPI00223E42F9|nr:helix-turn-helix transcriptional regulator [Aquabacterium sp. A7-Y]MCW7540474.1 helix-turn-helix domain-containing protein [Aquabacterium sp. A7-Y]